MEASIHISIQQSEQEQLRQRLPEWQKKSFHIFRKIMLMVLSWLVLEVPVHVAVQRS